MSEVTATSVTCNHCGGPLDVPPGTRFVTCAHCGSRLEIHRTGNALYTEVLDAIDQRTREIADDVDVIRRQNEIERLDREWQMRREELLVHGKRGSTSAPSAVGGFFAIILALGFGIFWMSIALRQGGGPFALFGLLFIGVGVASGISMIVKAGKYTESQREYESRRAQLMRSGGGQSSADVPRRL